jgi:Short C-terminal domain
MKAICVLLCLVLAACSATTQTKLSYAPATGVNKFPAEVPPISVGTFTDERGESPTWYGAIRGGFGNPLKVLESDRPIALMVQDAFSNGVKARGVIPDATASSVQISGVIKKLQCDQVAKREADIEIEVLLTDVRSGQQRFRQLYTTTLVEGSALALNTGIFGSVEDLRQTAEKALNQTVDKALDDSTLRLALQTAGQGTAVAGSDVAEKLRTLDKLKKDGLISQQEYDAKRQEILKGL